MNMRNGDVYMYTKLPWFQFQINHRILITNLYMYKIHTMSNTSVFILQKKHTHVNIIQFNTM